MRYQMTARTDRSDSSRYSPAYATGREFGARRIVRLSKPKVSRQRDELIAVEMCFKISTGEVKSAYRK